LDTTNTLDSITVSDCTLDPAFNSATTEYSCTVKNNVTSVTVNATATSTKSKVRGLGTKELSVGANTLPIRVIAEDGSEKIYNVNVTRKAVASLLKNEIMKNTVITANPTLTTSSNNTSDASGLYKSTATNTGEATYYFRGNVENNYVSFAGQIWRIVRINEDGTIRLITQNIINSTSYKFNSIINNSTYMYYSNSQAKTQLESWYQTNIGSKSDLAQNVASGAYYCEQAKVKEVSEILSGNATMTVYNKYTPDFKCTTDGNGKGIVNASVGLLSYDEVVYAGGYPNQENNNYYLYNQNFWWTMSPNGFISTFSYSSVWVLTNKGKAHYSCVDMNNGFRVVLVLKSDTMTTGTGTNSDPFVVE
ncbi:cadherin-like beta sandwich domain-containing protein, partial [bacterium]|nr:cadherin-like beta sandwich domain-containing protein [bacterium]